MSKITQPLKWHGGKHYLAEWIRSLAPSHRHRVYLYAGGLGEMWGWPAEGVSEVANDLNGYLINFYRVLQRDETFADFKRLIEATPFSRDEWSAADIAMSECRRLCVSDQFGRSTPPDVEIAAAFFVWNRQSMAGRMNCFSPLTKTRSRGGRNAETNAWWSCVEGLAEVKARLDRVVLERDDALRVIRREDSPQTLFYVDPPYVLGKKGEGRSTPDVYQHEVDDAHHKALVGQLLEVEGKVMLSGYANAIYDAALTLARGWVRHEREIDNKAAAGGSKRKMVECLWCNFPPTLRNQ